MGRLLGVSLIEWHGKCGPMVCAAVRVLKCSWPSMAQDRARFVSKHYRLGDFLVDAQFSDLAERLMPGTKEVENLERLGQLIDRIVDHFPSGWRVISGYRNLELNEACRKAGRPASVHSLHLEGCAADLQPADENLDLEAVFEWIREHSHRDLPVHEAVYYPMKKMIHVAVVCNEKPSPRRFLTRT